MSIRLLAPTRRQKVAVAVMLAVLISISHFPLILGYLISKGLVEHPEIRANLPVQVGLRDDWYALASTDSLLGWLLAGKTTSPSVVYQRRSWLLPLNSSRIIVSRFSLPTDAKAESIAQEIKRFSWGEAYLVKPSITGTYDFRILVERNFGVGILYYKEQDLAAITSLTSRRTQSPK